MAANEAESGIQNEGNSCYHCGSDCGSLPVNFDEKIFCCTGCRTVYEILSSNDACEYYRFETHPGLRASEAGIGSRYAWLDNAEIIREMVEFSDDGISRVKFFIPAIHCSSCIWLLENLSRLNGAVIFSAVNFVRKEVTVTFRDRELSLRQLVELLVSVNYMPQLSQDSLNKGAKGKVNRGIYYRLGVAGFCFGNIMLFSFPAYLSINDSVENLLRQNFGILNILFGIPVAFYSGSIFIVSAWKGLKKKFISIDVPIATGILVLFFRSVFEIVTGTGPGFMDSLAGLVFFLSIGRWYQDKTYQALSFERDYKSYFPVAVTILTDTAEETVIPLKRLRTGMRMVIRNQELVPADAMLVAGEGAIDYSFVSGESTPVKKKPGDRVFAGGRQVGASIELIVEKEVAQSRLTELWNQDLSGELKNTHWDSIMNVISRYFTLAVLLISSVAGAWWWFISPSDAAMVVTAILIVACPCALAMTLPFTFGGTMRVFGRNGCYLKRAEVVEAMAGIDTIVFDKTGTLTTNEGLVPDLSFLTATPGQLTSIASLVKHSTHPVSVAISRHLAGSGVSHVSNYLEVPSRGIEGFVNGSVFRIGSCEFVTGQTESAESGTSVFISCDGQPLGKIVLRNSYRDGMEEVIRTLTVRYSLHLLSGDNDSERGYLRTLFTDEDNLHFSQSPQDKLHYVRRLKEQGKKVLMVGDGLNDAGALKESHCGISIADDVYHFSPACDAILESAQFARLEKFLSFTRRSMRIVYLSMTLSFLYNVVGLSYAVTGNLSPIVSAILMPLSSVSIVGFVTVSVLFIARLRGFYKIY